MFFHLWIFIIKFGGQVTLDLLCVLHWCMMDVRFKTPANFFICGQTQSGKSYLTRRILQNAEELFEPVPTNNILLWGISKGIQGIIALCRNDRGFSG